MMVRIQVEEIRLLLLYLHHRSLQIDKRKKFRIWDFLYWSELEFVKLVKGESDHQYDITLFTRSNKSQILTTGN